MDQPDAVVFRLNAVETQQWQESFAEREALKATMYDRLAYPGTEHYRIYVLSVGNEVLFID
jgi:hypothetical protein